MRSTLWQWGEDVKDLLEEGVLCRGLTEFSGDWDDLLSHAEKKGVYLDTFARGTSETPIRETAAFTARQLSPWGGSMQLLEEDLQNMLHNKWACIVLAGGEKAAKTTAADLAAKGFPAAYLEDPETVREGRLRFARRFICRHGIPRRFFRRDLPWENGFRSGEKTQEAQKRPGDHQPSGAFPRRLCGAFLAWYRRV